MGSIATYIADKAAKKKQTPAEWLEDNLKNLDRYWVSSHIGRYTHPDAAVHLHDDSSPTGKGYLTTADAVVKQDIYVDGVVLGFKVFAERNYSGTEREP